MKKGAKVKWFGKCAISGVTIPGFCTVTWPNRTKPKRKKIKSMKKLTAILLAVSAIAFTGCLTSKTQTVTGTAATGFSTNTVTTVNEANLALDSAGLQSMTAISVSMLVNKNAGLVPPLKNAQVALDGILNGSNPQTTAQVLAMLKAQNNADMTTEITSLVTSVSQLEQDLLKKYGASVAGEITVALVRAVDRGLIVGLAGR